jgi:hypothetical protein
VVPLRTPAAAVDAALATSVLQSSSTLAAQEAAQGRGNAYEDLSPNDDDMDAALELLFAGGGR